MELSSLIRKPGPRIGRIAAASIALFLAALGVSIAGSGTVASGSTLDHGPRVMAPRGVRIKVQVLNASTTPGLAARATRYLRDRGFDVVESGTSSRKVEKTEVLDRSGKGEWGRLVAMAFGTSEAREEPDSSRYLDVTVLLGPDWSPPPKAFHP